MTKAHAQANRLIHEKSPYLLQHAYNPVDWRPWGEEAFDEARTLDKPVFLSIGYATCHWCHVMERESFENEEIAQRMNQAFVNIKVDREERPDIDLTYMTASLVLSGGGGWPLNVLLTPDKLPFFTATYIPPKGKFGRMGMDELVERIKNTWLEKRSAVQNSAEQITAAMQRAWSEKNNEATALDGPAGEAIGAEHVERAYQELEQAYDKEFAGFGAEPKFPSPHTLLFLQRYAAAHPGSQARSMTEATLLAMREGGIHDHIGRGYHRYSTDRHWLLPHFEKMLYDQGMMALAFTEAYELSGASVFRTGAQEIFDYVLRDMRADNGAFYSAEDADSEGEEGKFYVFTLDELFTLLGDDAELAAARYGARAEGNFKDEATGKLTGANILHGAVPIEELAQRFALPKEQVLEKLENACQTLFLEREKRERPLLDDKTLTSWNGLFIAALARAARAFDQPELVAPAEKAARFILEKLNPESGLLHRYREGEAGIDAHLDDYAYLAWGLGELYLTTRDAHWLELSEALCDTMVRTFWDAVEGAFYFTAADAKELPVRPREVFDAAMPSGNSVALKVLDLLARERGRKDFEELAQTMLQALAPTVGKHPSGHAFLLWALPEE